MTDHFPWLSHRSMAEIIKDEQNLPDLRVVGGAFLALSQSPESSRRRKDDPLARRESGESNMKGRT